MHLLVLNLECGQGFGEEKVTLTHLLHGLPSPLRGFGTPAQRLLLMTEALRGTKEQGEEPCFTEAHTGPQAATCHIMYDREKETSRR